MNKKIGHSRQGQRMLKENLYGARAAYGKQILVTVSRELTAEYGRGFSYAELACMVQFPQFFPEESIVVTPLQQLSWSHFHALLPIKDSLARDFYQQPLSMLEKISLPLSRRQKGATHKEFLSVRQEGTRQVNRMRVRGIDR